MAGFDVTLYGRFWVTPEDERPSPSHPGYSTRLQTALFKVGLRLTRLASECASGPAARELRMLTATITRLVDSEEPRGGNSTTHHSRSGIHVNKTLPSLKRCI